MTLQDRIDPMIDRRTVLLGVGGTLIAPHAGASEWRKIAPAEAALADDIEERLGQLLAEKRAWGLHGVVVTRKGALVLERYFEGEDEAWGDPLGRVAFTPDTLHDLRSVTKSILGLLYGIARAQEKVPAPERLLTEFFADAAARATDPRVKRLTVAHALTMTLGFDWNEDIPYQDPANSEIQMELAADRFGYIFTRPFIADPGTRWIYGAAGTAIIGRLITHGTGMSLHDFARANLFDPLGLGKTVWTNGFNGEPAPASGLRMTPRDLARIGQLILNRGEWEGRRIVPAAWLDASFAPHVSADEQRRYGYFWYSGDFQYGNPPNRPLAHWVGGFGYGGQRLFVMPGLDIVVAITCGNYADERQWMPPIRIVREVVLASVQ
jgi:CubicO group peptidase (beta-lactamase class C family)